MPDVDLADVSPDDLRRIVRLLRRRLAAILSAERVFARELSRDAFLYLEAAASLGRRLIRRVPRVRD
jgi:hypothetical protein